MAEAFHSAQSHVFELLPTGVTEPVRPKFCLDCATLRRDAPIPTVEKSVRIGRGVNSPQGAEREFSCAAIAPRSRQRLWWASRRRCWSRMRCRPTAIRAAGRATAFRSDWVSVHRAQLTTIANALRDASNRATANANQQEQASS